MNRAVPDDARLVERVRAGDAAASEELARRHLRAAYAVALAVVGDPQDAEDVSQDAFIVALERLHECRQPGRFAAWLLQIVRNRARNARRGRAVRAALPLREAMLTPGRENPGRDAELGELRDRLTNGLARLTEVQREVVLLHDLDGWRHREIADALGIAEGTARYHLSLARRSLRDWLGTEPRVEETGHG